MWTRIRAYRFTYHADRPMVGGSSRCVDTCAPLIREHGVMHHTWRPPSCLLFHVAGGMHPLVAWACDESGLCVYTKRIACIHKASLCTQKMLCVYTEQAGEDTMTSIVCIRNIRTRSRGRMCIHIERSQIHNIRSHMHHTVLELCSSIHIGAGLTHLPLLLGDHFHQAPVAVEPPGSASCSRAAASRMPTTLAPRHPPLETPLQRW